MATYSYYEELDSENEDDLNQLVESFDEAVIWGTDWTAETITNQLKRKNIDLFPKFQRRDAWSQTAKSKFIESLILGLPIPQIILAEKKDEKGKYIVIDGKQRLLTIRQFFAEEKEDDFTQLKLKGLDVLSKLNKKTFREIDRDPSFNQIINQLLNQTIRTTVIRNWPNEEFLFTVFLRLNTGSIKLSPQELRQALHPGKFIDFADTFSIESVWIRKMFNLDQPDFRMRDVEVVVRFFAFRYFIKEYDGNLKKAFDDTVKKLNKEWDNLKDDILKNAKELDLAIEFIINTFGEKEAFSKWVHGKFQGNFNRAIFDIMVYYFSNPAILNTSRGKESRLVEAFKHLCENDTEFVSSIESTTKSITNTAKRLQTWGEVLAEILEMKISTPFFDPTSSRMDIKDSDNG